MTDANSNLTLAELELKAAAYRAKADELDMAVAAVYAALDKDGGKLKPSIASNSPIARKRAPKISTKWVSVLLELARYQHALGTAFDMVFTIDAVDVVLKRQMKPSEVLRHFEAYIEAGWLEMVGDNQNEFWLTDAGLKKIDYAANKAK
ncbi:MAG: hypothetical protein ABJ242_11515 [Marinomonas sp.]